MPSPVSFLDTTTLQHLGPWAMSNLLCQGEGSTMYQEPLVASLLLVAMPGAPSSFLLLVVRPGAPSSVLIYINGTIRLSISQIRPVDYLTFTTCLQGHPRPPVTTHGHRHPRASLQCDDHFGWGVCCGRGEVDLCGFIDLTKADASTSFHLTVAVTCGDILRRLWLAQRTSESLE